MKRSLPILLSFVIAFTGKSQQTIAYTQYTFNKAGMNPAASGTLIDQKYFFSAGVRRQWTAFEKAPKQNFVNVSYTLREPRSFRYWQNFSIYADNDEAGLLGNTGAYLGYATHWLLRKKQVLSFGIYAGIRQFTRNTGGFDPNDPAVMNSGRMVLAYPDLIPGIRFSNDRMFAGLSVRQISITRQRDLFSKKAISTGGQLQPTVYMDYGRKYRITDRLTSMPSVAVQIPVIGLPVVDLNLMYYFANRIGGGFALRNNNFLSGIVQVRFLKNMTAGFAYSYPINAMRFAAQNSYELMIGVVPYGMDARESGTHSVARCPDLSW